MVNIKIPKSWNINNENFQSEYQIGYHLLLMSTWCIHLTVTMKLLVNELKPEPHDAWLNDVHADRSDYEHVYPDKRSNKRSISEVHARWKHLSKGCIVLWNNWINWGRYTEKDLHVSAIVLSQGDHPSWCVSIVWRDSDKIYGEKNFSKTGIDRQRFINTQTRSWCRIR